MQKIHDRLDGYEPGQFKNKFKMLFIIVSIALTLIVMRLWYLQVIKGDELRQRSENNSVRLRKIKSMRGLIMDAGRQVLVDNQPSFDLVFIPNRTKRRQYDHRKDQNPLRRAIPDAFLPQFLYGQG